MPSRTTSVIVAALDEESTILDVLAVALNDASVIEVIVADGGSKDTTVAKIRQAAQRDARVHLIANPDRAQSAGLNRAASRANGELLVRMDAHTRYASNYVAASAAAWEPGAAVGGPMLAEGDSPFAEAVAVAMGDPLAVGPARFHHADAREDVDTVYLGTFSRRAFLEIGGYRTFPSGTVEDTDFYSRWRAAGHRVVVDPAIRSWYRPRDSLRSLATQYFRYGVGKAELFWVNGRFPSFRPLAPAALVGGLTALFVLGLVATWIPFGLLAAAWVGTLAIVALRSPKRRLRTAIATATMHISYGSGVWVGAARGRPRVETLGLLEHTAD